MRNIRRPTLPAPARHGEKINNCLSLSRLYSILVITAIAIIAQPVHAKVQLRCEIKQFGVVNLQGSSRMRKNDNDGTRVIRSFGGTEVESVTSDIPMEIGMSFGAQTVLLGRYPKPEADYESRWTFPERDDPNTGEPVSESVAHATSRLGRRILHFLTLDSESDLVVGVYRLELLHEGKVLCSQTFDVSLPSADDIVTEDPQRAGSVVPELASTP